MRITNVALAHDAALGGLHRAVEDFSRALAAGIVSFEPGAVAAPARAPEGTVVARIPCGAWLPARGCHLVSAAAGRQAARALADADLLVVHSLFRGHAPWAAGFAARQGRRYWAVPHACLDPRTLARGWPAKQLWLGTLGRGFLDRAERIVFSSRRSQEKAGHRAAAGRSVVIHWPVAAAHAQDRGRERSRFRAAHGIPDAARLLLALGRLHGIKRPVETIRSFAAAAPGHCHLVVAGMDGDLTRSQLARLVPATARDRVHLIGGLVGAEVAAAYLASDGFISLSWQENFGYAAADALAHGLPVILSPGHDLAAEMPALDGRFACGWLLPDDSSAAAEAAIAEFGMAPDAVLAAAGAAGRAWAAEELSFAQFRDRLRAML
jgi:glycosyltransferase involved in cell wall biosynthesis